MKLKSKALLLAGIQVALVGSLGAKLLVDRAVLPRAWARVTPFDPSLPIRGRYLRLRLYANAASESGATATQVRVKLLAVDGRLVARPVSLGSRGLAGVLIRSAAGATVTIQSPVAFFLPEHALDPSHPGPGEELWAEVSVPHQGLPRPIRLGIKKNGKITPLDLR